MTAWSPRTLSILLVAGCTGAAPARPRDPSPVTPAAVEAAPAPAASAAAPVASDVPPAPPASSEGPCRGARVDVLAAVAADCRVLREEPFSVPPELAASVRAAPGPVAPGATVTFDVVLKNTGTSTLVLFLDTGIEAPDSKGRDPKVPVTAERGLTQFWVTLHDKKGHRFERPRGSLPLSVIELSQIELRPPVRLELAPGGEAIAPVRWRAVGFLPGKAYRSSPKKSPTGSAWNIPDPDPLPPGEYSLVLFVPLWKTDDVSVATTVVVDAPESKAPARR